LKGDVEIVVAALTQNKRAFAYVSDELKTVITPLTQGTAFTGFTSESLNAAFNQNNLTSGKRPWNEASDPEHMPERKKMRR
jgi:hypothetical protein